MIIRAAAISEFEFAHYGIYYNMPKDGERVMHSRTASYEDHMTRLPLIDTSAHLGYTLGQSAPYTMHSMEKHAHTMEAVFCAAAPIVLCVAVSRGSLPPQAEECACGDFATGRCGSPEQGESGMTPATVLADRRLTITSPPAGKRLRSGWRWKGRLWWRRIHFIADIDGVP